MFLNFNNQKMAHTFKQHLLFNALALTLKLLLKETLTIDDKNGLQKNNK